MAEKTVDDKQAILFGICAFAQLGVLLRLALSGWKNYDSHQMSSVLYANFIGCFVIGFFNNIKPLLVNADLTPLFHAGSVGFCGALTTFSTWQLEICRWIVWWPNTTVQATYSTSPGFIHQALTVISALLTEVGIASVGFQLGRMAAQVTIDRLHPPPDPSDEESSGHAPTDRSGNAPTGDIERTPNEKDPLLRSHTTKQHHVFDDILYKMEVRSKCVYCHGAPDDHHSKDLNVTGYDPYQRYSFMALFSIITCVTLYFMFATMSKRSIFVFLIVVLGPLGALLRYYLGIWYNAKPQGLGTFLANIVACVIVGTLTVIDASNGCFPEQPKHSSLLKAIQFGFCGSLSTMSSFVAQLHEWPTNVAARYGAASLVTAPVVLCAILGTYLHISGATSVCV